MVLWRAVGVEELRLVYEASMRAFPPRTPEERLFCPVLNEWHARAIAEDASRRYQHDGSFVLRFSIDDRYASGFEPHTVRREHEELWVPAEQLWELNEHIEGPIRLVSASFGERYRGYVPERFGMRDMDATQQFLELVRMLPQRAFDFRCEVAANHAAVFVNFPFWCRDEFLPGSLSPQRKLHTLDVIRTAWKETEHRRIPLGLPAS